MKEAIVAYRHVSATDELLDFTEAQTMADWAEQGDPRGQRETNTRKFDGMGKIYAKFRPSYPQEFMDYLYCCVGMGENGIAADIGSGTGILTRQILERGGKVFAVEPNADMRAAAEAELIGFDGFVSVNGSAENTTLADHSVDFITAAQAFHWFDRRRFKAECERILKPNGKVILVWNSRDEASEMVRENDAANKKYCPSFKGFSGGMRGAESDDDFKDFFAGEYETKIFNNELVFDERGFVGRNLSASYALKDGDGEYAAYVAELKNIFDKYSSDGRLAMPNFTRSYAGRI